LARRLLENGVAHVQVMHSNYDTHYENFDFHIEQLGEFDRPFATLMEDLAQRGLLETTLVVVMSEFGRTPRINGHVGRDHWPEAWSLAMAGTGLKRGVVVGETNELGTWVTSEAYDIGHLFHTWFHALGIDPDRVQFDNGGQPLPIAHEEMSPVREVLA
jgi:uncharacterized protein (DUF1501 family)